MEQKKSKLSEFRSEPFRGTENSRNSVPDRSAEEKNARNSVPWKKIEANSLEFRSEACLGQNMLSILFAGAGFFVKLLFSCHFLPFRASELTLP
jgi:hypothetical protein